MSTVKLVMALVLVDVAAHQLKAGTLLEADKSLIDALVKSGEVDPHRDAVKHAQAQGLPVVRSAIELAAEQLAAERQALLVEIGSLEQSLSTATSDDVKNAISAEITAKRAAVAALG